MSRFILWSHRSRAVSHFGGPLSVSDAVVVDACGRGRRKRSEAARHFHRATRGVVDRRRRASLPTDHAYTAVHHSRRPDHWQQRRARHQRRGRLRGLPGVVGGQRVCGSRRQHQPSVTVADLAAARRRRIASIRHISICSGRSCHSSV